MRSLNAAGLSFGRLEKAARYVMGAAAALAIGGVAAFNAGYIQSTPDYEVHAWYRISDHRGFQVITKFGDEAACRERAEIGECQSGRALITARYRNAPVDQLAKSAQATLQR